MADPLFDMVKNDNIFREQNPVEIQRCTEFLMGKGISTILEIGFRIGGSCAYWLELNPSLLMTIDHTDTVVRNSGSEHYAIAQTMHNRFDHELDRRGGDYIRIDGNSHSEVVLAHVHNILTAYGLTVDYMFIDGDHDYDGVKQDFEQYSQFMSPHGFIGFHDINRADGVRRLWEEIKGRKISVEFIDAGVEYGIGVISNE